MLHVLFLKSVAGRATLCAGLAADRGGLIKGRLGFRASGYGRVATKVLSWLSGVGSNQVPQHC